MGKVLSLGSVIAVVLLERFWGNPAYQSSSLGGWGSPGHILQRLGPLDRGKWDSVTGFTPRSAY